MYKSIWHAVVLPELRVKPWHSIDFSLLSFAAEKTENLFTDVRVSGSFWLVVSKCLWCALYFSSHSFMFPWNCIREISAAGKGVHVLLSYIKNLIIFILIQAKPPKWWGLRGYLGGGHALRGSTLQQHLLLQPHLPPQRLLLKVLSQVCRQQHTSVY